jgi:nucleoside-diphosphate-sugar epimerase
MFADPITSLSGRHLLVTGHRGSSARGSAVAPSRRARPFTVSRGPEAEAGGVRSEQGDHTEEAVARELVRRVEPDVVLHLASEVSGGRDLALMLPMLRGNLLAAVNLMVACAEADRPRDAVAKWGQLAYARHFPALHELPLVHLRVLMVYGPGQLDLRKLVPYVTVLLLRGQAPKLTSIAPG